MTPIDRAVAPKSKGLKEICFNTPNEYRLQNGIPVYTLIQKDTPIVSITLDFKAGEYYQNQAFIALAVSRLLTKGTKHFSAKKIAEKIACQGAEINTHYGTNLITINLICTKDKLKSVLPILSDIIQFPTFEEKELEQLKEKELQMLHLKMQKVDYLSNRKFFNQIFGDKHPFGNILEEKHIQQVHPEILKEYHSTYFVAERCKIHCAGNIDEKTIQLLDTFFGNTLTVNFNSIEKPHKRFPTKEKFHLIEKNDAVQSSVKIGFAMDRPTEEDFMQLKILNTIYGGNYCSRLMQNIRQEKGYTYGIHSSASIYHDSLVFLIQTETGAEYTQKVMDEIFSEMIRLQNALVSKKELMATQNWISGSLLRMFDGAFNQMNVYRQLHSNGLSQHFYTNYFESIKNINPQQIKSLAKQYLNPDVMFQVVAGILTP